MSHKAVETVKEGLYVLVAAAVAVAVAGVVAGGNNSSNLRLNPLSRSIDVVFCPKL